NRIVINPPRPFIDNLDHLPLGFYADLELTRYVPHVTQYVRLPHYSVMTQRGCPNSCTYCGASKILGKKVRFYSPIRIVEELKILKFEKKARGFYFQDSTFTMNRDFVMELMRLVIEAKLNLLWSCNTRADRVDPDLLRLMYQAGGRQIAVGVESANQASLDMIKKNTTVQKQTQGVRWIREAGFRCNNSFIICLPGENDEMVHNTICYAKKLKAPLAIFWLPVPYPGTELYETCKNDGGLRQTNNWNDFLSLNFDNPVYVNPKLGLDKMRYWHKRANFEYYTYPLVWWENMKFINSIDDFRRIGQGILILVEMFSASILHVLSNLFARIAARRFVK
ncbi:MAG: radical SAM protein, partial [bacterium]|nr:radical SAM protein [bacterium]